MAGYQEEIRLRTLLIDADILAYQCSAATEQRIDWGDGVVSRIADFREARRSARDRIDALVADLQADNLIICLSDDFDNFRKELYPPYKSHRQRVERPTHLYDLKEWLSEKYPTRMIRFLEADDVLGIAATEPHSGERIIVSEDKDLQTVPALLYNPARHILGVREITPEDAERFMLWQAICGDPTDGYPGCPGSGPAAADRLLEGRGWEPYVHVFQRGPRRGTEEVRWREVEMGRWPAIVSAYRKAGLTEDDAVVQVNLARILKHGDFDGKRPIKWVPPRGAN